MLHRTFCCCGLRIIRHNGRSSRLDSRGKRRQVVGFQAAGGGVHVPLARSVMGVKAIFARAAAREVLGRYRNAILGHTMVAALNTGDNMGHNLADQGWILAKSTVGTLPARVGYSVCHVHIAFTQAAGVPFAADGIGKLVHKINFAALNGGGNAQGTGPGCQHAARIVHSEHQLAILVAGVGRRCHRDKVLALLTHCIRLVHPISQIGGGGVGTQDNMAVEPVFEQGRGAGQVLLAENCFAAEFALIQNACLVSLFLNIFI